MSDPTDRLVDEGELWRRMRAGDDGRAREELVRRHLPYAQALARRYRAAAEPSEDLAQVASLGLLKAIDRFDVDRGVPFHGFAAPTILGELKRHFRDRIWTVRVPRSLQESIANVDKASAELRAKLQRSPSVREIAEHLSIPPTDVLEAMEADQKRHAVSLDRPLPSDGDDGTLGDLLGETDGGFELTEDRLAIEGAVPSLGEREQLVLKLRFSENLTQSEIAKRVGCSQMQVSRILRRTLTVLRERIDGPPGEGDEAQAEGPAIRNTT